MRYSDWDEIIFPWGFTLSQNTASDLTNHQLEHGASLFPSITRRFGRHVESTTVRLLRVDDSSEVVTLSGWLLCDVVPKGTCEVSRRDMYVCVCMCPDSDALGVCGSFYRLGHFVVSLVDPSY